MENPDNEDIIIPVCILLIAAGIQQYRGNVSEDWGIPCLGTRIIIGEPKWSQELFKDGCIYHVLTMCFYLLMML